MKQIVESDHTRIRVLEMKVEMLVAMLEEAAECLNGYADVRDGDGGRPQPNAAMSMESMITEFLREVKK